MASQWQRDNEDGPADQSPHFFKIILPNVVQEGKLVSMLKFMVFFLSENHMLIHVVHLTFFIYDSWKNLHLFPVVIKSFILQYVGYILRRKHSHITECFYIKFLDMNEKWNKDKRMVQTKEKKKQIYRARADSIFLKMW